MDIDTLRCRFLYEMAKSKIMNYLQQIEQKIHQGDITSMTFDIFDTILLRKIHPEDKQFLMVAEKWLPIFQENISAELTAFKIYSWRIYTRNELFDINNKYVIKHTLFRKEYYDVTLETWFTNLVVSIAHSYDIKLGYNKIKTMVSTMIKIELSTEVEQLYPNTKLIHLIERIKNEHQDLKVYYVSDMYLTSDQINRLLKAHGIECFDGGISSTDARCVKWDASIFYRIANDKPFGENFNLFKNLHIGDNKNSDYKMPRKAGSDAVWFSNHVKSNQNAAERGKRQINKLKQKIVKQERKRLNVALKTSNNVRDTWIKYGELFSLPMFIFLGHVAMAARNAPDTKFVLVSSEATFFKKIADAYFAKELSLKNIIIANTINRRTVIRAFAYYLAHDDNSQYNLNPIYKTLCFGEIDGSKREIYKFFFGEEFPFSELVLNNRTPEEFFQSFLQDIRTADAKYTKTLEESYLHVQALIKNFGSNNIIVDVGWGGTVQIILSELCKMLDPKQKISGLYLGAHPADRFGLSNSQLDGYLMKNVRDGKDRQLWNAVIWEYAYTNKVQYDADQSRLALIRNGFEQGHDLFKDIELSPYDYFTLVVRKNIQRLISKPKRNEVEAIGNIEFDCGFTEKTSFNIVELGYSQKNFYKMLAINPKFTIFSIIYRRNCWPAGYIKYYHLYGLKALIKFYGKIRRKHYI